MNSSPNPAGSRNEQDAITEAENYIASRILAQRIAAASTFQQGQAAPHRTALKRLLPSTLLDIFTVN